MYLTKEVAMRSKKSPQISLFEIYNDHELGQQLKCISSRLDAHPEILDLALKSLTSKKLKATGRNGLTADSVVRASLLKQMMGLSYEELSFYISDSISYQTFVRTHINPRASTLQAAISGLDADTWEAINKVLLIACAEEGLEKGRTVRIDSTVTESHIHPPTDSSLLCDCVRTLSRVMDKLKELMPNGTVRFCNHCRSAKKLGRDIEYARSKNKTALYKKLVSVTKSTVKEVQQAIIETNSVSLSLAAQALVTELTHWTEVTCKVISQTQRRVFNGEKVPATEKLVSIFETHTDIIIKGSRDTQFGHKLNITTGKSGLVLDVVVEKGSPADSDKLCPMIKRQEQIYGRVPRQTAADGGYASQENLKQAKEMGVKDVAFNKKKGLKVDEMVKSHWVYKRLTKFRAGIEGNISCLKRRYGLTRCFWKGLKMFKAYVWSSTVAYNLMVLAKLSSA